MSVRRCTRCSRRVYLNAGSKSRGLVFIFVTKTRKYRFSVVPGKLSTRISVTHENMSASSAKNNLFQSASSQHGLILKLYDLNILRQTLTAAHNNNNNKLYFDTGLIHHSVKVETLNII